MENKTNSTTVSTDEGALITNLRVFILVMQLGVMLPMGIFGSIVSLIVFSRRTFRSSAMGKYFFAQSAADLVFQVYIVYTSVLKSFSPGFCRATAILFGFELIFNSLIKTAVSIDRLLLVRFPFKFAFIKTRLFQYSVIAVIAAVSSIPTALMQAWMQYEPSGMRNGVKSCFVQRDPTSLSIATYFRFYDLYLGHSIPFLTMLICGLLIINKVFRMKAKCKRSNSNQCNKERTLAIFTVFAISWYLILNTNYIAVLVYQLYFYDPFVVNSLYPFFQLMSLFLRTSEINTSILVHIVCNKLYRAELQTVFCCLCSKFRNKADKTANTLATNTRSKM